jgi:hypothetical protein
MYDRFFKLPHFPFTTDASPSLPMPVAFSGLSATDKKGKRVPTTSPGTASARTRARRVLVAPIRASPLSIIDRGGVPKWAVPTAILVAPPFVPA